MAATGHRKSDNLYIFGNKRYRNLNSKSFYMFLKYDESNVTIIFLKIKLSYTSNIGVKIAIKLSSRTQLIANINIYVSIK